MTTTEHELLTITEAADLLRVPVATLRWWRHKGIGPRSLKNGRHVLYRYSDLVTFIEERLQQGDPDAA